MVRGKLALAAGALALAALTAPAGGAQAVRNGGGISTRSATPGAVDFDPPTTFKETLPLRGFYLNPKTGMSFAGGGAVLSSGANFGVTGFSPPDFLAFDCGSRNADGTAAKLPMQIKFSKPVLGVSMKVGSLNDAGTSATLTAFDAKGAKLGQRSVIAAAAMQTLGVSAVVGQAPIASVKLTGPCNLVVDDILAGDGPM